MNIFERHKLSGIGLQFFAAPAASDRLAQIEVRLAAIPAELDAEGADLDALKTEVTNLKAERKEILDAAEKRKKILQEIAGGAGTVVRTLPDQNDYRKPFALPPEERSRDAWNACAQGIILDSEQRIALLDAEEYRTAWLKNLQGKPLDAAERAAVTATAAIPTQTMNRIISTLEQNPMIAAIDITYIPGNVSWPKEKTANDASWIDMGTSSTDSADELEDIALGAFKLIKTLEITANVQAMSIPAFENWLVARLANKIMKAVDAAIFTGTGTNQATGLQASGQLPDTGTWTAAGMKYSELLAVLAALPTQYHPNARFVTTRQVFFGQIFGLTTDGGDKVVVADAQSPAKFNILGYPVIVDDNCKADTLLFGDFKEGYKFNFAQSPTVESDRSVGFRTGSTVWRAMALCDGKPGNKDAVVQFKKGE